MPSGEGVRTTQGLSGAGRMLPEHPDYRIVGAEGNLNGSRSYIIIVISHPSISENVCGDVSTK